MFLKVDKLHEENERLKIKENELYETLNCRTTELEKLRTKLENEVRKEIVKFFCNYDFFCYKWLNIFFRTRNYERILKLKKNPWMN